ncbi:MAG TPA: TadE/TadG family type IV pilus assembly protein, partial [Allosphingosinicella sp.]
MLKRLFPRGEKGIGAVEFALIAPVLIGFIVGVSQVGRMFYANADMKNASAHAARLASIYRTGGTVDDATLIAAVKARLLRDGAASKVTVTVTRGTDNGNPYVELKTDYSVPLE